MSLLPGGSRRQGGVRRVLARGAVSSRWPGAADASAPSGADLPLRAFRSISLAIERSMEYRVTRQMGASAGEPPVAATTVFGCGRECTALSRLQGGAFRDASAAGAQRAGLPGTFGERSHQVVKILSTAVDGALRARQDVNGRVGVVDTFRVLVHDLIASSDLLHRSVAYGRFGWGAQRRYATEFLRDACYRTEFRAP